MAVNSQKLRPNKTYRCRTATLVVVSKAGWPMAGVLEVDERVDEAKKSGKVRRYAVKELPPTEQGRVFRLCKPLKDDGSDGDRYHTLLGFPPLMLGRCDCHAGQHMRCVHLEALQAFRTAGALPEVFPRPDQTREPGNPVGRVETAEFI